MRYFLYIENDNLLKMVGLKDLRTGQFVNNATVQATVMDLDDNPVSGQIWPTPMTYVATSNGDYEAVMEDGLVLTDNQQYKAEVEVDAGSDKIAKFTVDLQARVRGTS